MPDLISQYRQMHEAGHFDGRSLEHHIPAIRSLIKETNSTTVLDYGCGKAYLWKEEHLADDLGVTVALYDPAVVGIAKLPDGPFDGVICTDVLEHIPAQSMNNVINAIFMRARKFVFLSICTREARKTLPDGRNCHVTIRPELWWSEKIGGRQVRTQVVFT